MVLDNTEDNESFSFGSPKEVGVYPILMLSFIRVYGVSNYELPRRTQKRPPRKGSQKKNLIKECFFGIYFV